MTDDPLELDPDPETMRQLGYRAIDNLIDRRLGEIAQAGGRIAP